ncbi:Outer mitochondrial transmembrane helix translocase [Linum perenne]
MYAMIIKNCSNLKWGSVLMPSIQLIRPKTLHQSCVRSRIHVASARVSVSRSSLIRRYRFNSFSTTSGCGYISNTTRRSSSCLKKSQFRAFSSEGDGRNTSEDECAPLNGSPKVGDGKIGHRKVGGESRYCDTHASLAEQDQREWLNNEKLAVEAKKKESPFLTRRERFKNDFLRRVIPWEKIQVSWESFPYYIKKNTKNVLLECVTSHLKSKNVAVAYGSRLTSSSGRILLQSSPGTELYRERIVRALARKLQVPLLVLDSSALAPYNLDDCTSEVESDGATESGDEATSESEVDEESEAANDEEGGSEDDVVDLRAADEAAIRKLIPFDLEEFEKQVSGESEALKSGTAAAYDNSKRPLKKGDRVKYIGSSNSVEADNRITLGKITTSDGLKNAFTVIRGRPLSNGQRGEIYEISGNQVAVVWEMANDNQAKVDECEEHKEASGKSPVYWINVKEIEHDPDAEAEDCYIAMDALYEILQTTQPLIVYFPDFFIWLSRAVLKSNRKEFIHKMLEMFDQLSGSAVLICGHNIKVESGSKEKEKFTMILPNFGRLAKLPLPLKNLTEGLRGTKRSNPEVSKLFPNVLRIDPPKEEDLLRTFNKQIGEDRKVVISRSNLYELHKVLNENEMLCADLLDVNTDELVLTKQKAEKIVGWAKNHYLSSCVCPSIENERLVLPRESLEVAILRWKDHERSLRKPSQNLKNMAKDEYESNFVSAVVPPGEIGVRFNDVGALEDVKKALNELVILPMRRPELFTHGNLLRPCKGILLFGPPGTGKTLLAKALATEAGANFMSITGSTLTSKWFGDAEKLTKALFSFASKLAPVIIFVDEVDSLLGARGGSNEHEATRRMRNEFMAAWDGLRSKDSQRIIILGATNRPFDLDDAVIRRLPRRIYVDLPDASNRMKILKIILQNENLQSDFHFEELANATDGYSGSDLKNLCIAAAYRPVQEVLEKESKEKKDDYVEGSSLRPLTLDDFIQAKAKVGPSVSFDAASMNELRKWNEQYGEGGSRRKSPFGF